MEEEQSRLHNSMSLCGKSKKNAIVDVYFLTQLALLEFSFQTLQDTQE